MRIGFLLVAVGLLFVGCGLNLEKSSNSSFEKHYCKQPRADFCIKIYKPVCANNKTYSNGCVACQDSSVKYYTDGACKDRAKGLNQIVH
jgi:hypothetical protein